MKVANEVMIYNIVYCHLTTSYASLYFDLMMVLPYQTFCTRYLLSNSHTTLTAYLHIWQEI